MVRQRRIHHNSPLLARTRATKEAGVGVMVTLRYWREGPWYVGEMREVPDVFSQGRTLAELRRNISDAWDLMLEERPLNVRRPRRLRRETEVTHG